jgi:hypothetical protein
MAVTKTIAEATPYEQGGNVIRWEVRMQYEDGIKDTNSYYTSTFSTSVASTDNNDEEVFEEKSKGDWTLAEITALVPTNHWDNIFASQYDSVITNPPVKSEPDQDFELPSA